MQNVKIKIWFEVKNRLATDSALVPSFESESMWAIGCAETGYKIENSPFYTDAVNYRDRVSVDIRRVMLDDGEEVEVPYFAAVLERSGHRTLQLFFENESALKKASGVLAELHAAGCYWESADEITLAIDIPPKVDISDILHTLGDIQSAGGVILNLVSNK